MFPNRPANAPTVTDFAPIRVSVSTEASANASSVGPFRGFFAIVSTSFSIIGQNGKQVAINDLARNNILWVQGFVGVLNASAATATVTAAGTTDILFGVL